MKVPHEAPSHRSSTDSELISSLEDVSLKETQFTHEAHIRLAWIHLKNNGLNTAIDLVTKQIRAYVRHLGAQDKYHHTLTIAAVKTVHHFIKISPFEPFEKFIEHNPRLLSDFKTLVHTHYSEQLIQSELSRSSFCEPDLMPY